MVLTMPFKQWVKNSEWVNSSYIPFIITQALYMLAQLAVLVDGGARIFLSDTAKSIYLSN